ncbi:MAG: glycosyltransferase [Zoogloeaceae bacterium]|nr:glycosyltransferase [Zoogloeaceae bacterium]
MVIIPSLCRGGAERVVSRLTQEWARKNHDVEVAVFDKSDVAYAYGGRLIDLALPARDGALAKAANAVRRVFRLVCLLRGEKPERVISFMESANFPAILAALMAGRLDRLTVSIRNNPARFPLPYRLLMPVLYRLPGRVAAVSRGIVTALEKMGVPRKKLSFIPNPAPLITAAKKAERNIPCPDRYILGVGRLHPQKGFDRLISAFAGMRDPDLRLVILGEGEERANLEALASRLGVAGRVILPGAMDDLAPWYENARCFVLSSRHEGWPNVLVEAMAHGCPVAGFDCPYGPSEIVETGISGLLAPEGDVPALREAVRQVIDGEELREKLIENAARRIRIFDVETIAPAWLRHDVFRA